MPVSYPAALGAEDGPKVLPQWVQPDVLDGDDLLVDSGLLTAADSLADVNPVGGLVGRAAVALALNEGFEQHGLEAVALLPVVGQLAAHNGQDFGCESFALDPRQDQEPRVVDHELQVLEPLRFSPGATNLSVGKNQIGRAHV